VCVFFVLKHSLSSVMWRMHGQLGYMLEIGPRTTHLASCPIWLKHLRLDRITEGLLYVF